MGESRIEFDFKMALRRADELEEIARDLENLSGQDFEAAMQALGACWKGDSAAAYGDKCMKLQDKIHKSVEELLKVARNIRTVATRMYNAEMRAQQLAQIRWGR